MDVLLTAAANYGFPMVVAVYLLIRLDKRLDMLTQSVTELQSVIRLTYGQLAGTNHDATEAYPTAIGPKR